MPRIKFRFNARIATSAAIAAMSLLAASAAASASTLYTFSSGQPTAIYTNLTYNIGNEITVGASPLSVTAIGAFVNNALTGNQAYVTSGVTNVAFTGYIYSTTSATPLDTVTIPIGTTVDSQGFAYAPLTATLNANTSYIISEAMTGTGTYGTPFAYNSNGSAAGTFSGAAFVENRYATTTSGDPTLNNGVFKEFMGANLQYVAAPEPASLALFSGGAIGLLLLRRGRHRVL